MATAVQRRSAASQTCTWPHRPLEEVVKLANASNLMASHYVKPSPIPEVPDRLHHLARQGHCKHVHGHADTELGARAD